MPESPTIAAPEGAAIAATQRPMKANLLATWQREREEAAMRPVPPAFDSTRREFVAFLANLDLHHHAQRLMEEQIESVDDLMLLTRADIWRAACPPPTRRASRPGVPEMVRGGGRIQVVGGRRRRRRERCSSTRFWKTQRPTWAELETAHQAELKRLKVVLKERGVPDGYLCPISLEVMEDPVIAADGHSYVDRGLVQPRQQHVAQDGRLPTSSDAEPQPEERDPGLAEVRQFAARYK